VPLPSHRPVLAARTKPLACVMVPLVPAAPRVGRRRPWPRVRHFRQSDETGGLGAESVVVMGLLLGTVSLLRAEVGALRRPRAQGLGDGSGSGAGRREVQRCGEVGRAGWVRAGARHSAAAMGAHRFRWIEARWRCGAHSALVSLDGHLQLAWRLGSRPVVMLVVPVRAGRASRRRRHRPGHGRGAAPASSLLRGTCGYCRARAGLLLPLRGGAGRRGGGAAGRRGGAGHRQGGPHEWVHRCERGATDGVVVWQPAEWILPRRKGHRIRRGR
jgi:hypothetical protein